jgi:hypothetical protein
MVISLLGRSIGRLLLVSVVAAQLMLSLAYAANEARWHGKVLAEVSTKAQLPAAVKLALHMDDPGMAGVADIGRQFNTGDAHVMDWPDRALIGAGHVGEHWIVVLVHNGGQSAPRVWLYEFEGSSLLEHRPLRFWKGGADTFAAVVTEFGE